MYLPLKRKLQNTTSKSEKIWPVLAIVIILGVWQTASSTGIVPRFMLPSPVDVVKAFVADFPLLMSNARVTLMEAFIGLGAGVAVGFLMAVLIIPTMFVKAESNKKSPKTIERVLKKRTKTPS